MNFGGGGRVALLLLLLFGDFNRGGVSFLLHLVCNYYFTLNSLMFVWDMC